jgi:predicted ATP-grasp superfamily ATP-dependent carboligase
MRVFVYESLTATGTGRDPASPEHGMYREGRAMRDAVTGDLGRVAGVGVVAPEGAEFDRAARSADWCLVVAPECGGELLGLARRVSACGGRLLGPSLDAIGLCSDKLALAAHWRERGVRTPATTDREPTRCEPFPVVWKPRDGAGSTATFRLDSHFALASARAKLAAEGHTGPMVLQEFVPGRAASVAFLCGPAGSVPLLPAFQLLSDDGRFKYLGGELPIAPDLAERAAALARRAVDCVPGLLGYVGVDLVLGDAADGSRDFAVEINPRLTTSYVGLRALAGFNLCDALLAAASGEPPRQVRWEPGRVRFGPDGSVAPA